jgi:hypothetical protein
MGGNVLQLLTTTSEAEAERVLEYVKRHVRGVTGAEIISGPLNPLGDTAYFVQAEESGMLQLQRDTIHAAVKAFISGYAAGVFDGRDSMRDAASKQRALEAEQKAEEFMRELAEV